MACRDTIYQDHEPLAPTPPNVRYAHRVAEAIRRQLRAGHRVKVLREVYSRWLPGADGGRQKALSKDQALGDVSNFENTPISPGNMPAGKYTCETVLQELNCKRLTNTTYWSKS